MKQSLFAIALSFATAKQPSATKISVDTENRVLTDAFNRQVIMHGVNVVPKIAPYIPVQDHFDPKHSLTEKDMADLKGWGFNFIRLGVMWEAVERAPGSYNMTYLDQIDSLITKLGESGFHVLVDAHQDVAVRKLCGEGFPDFYATDLDHECDTYVTALQWLSGECRNAASYNWRYDANGDPLIEDCQKVMFANYYHLTETIDMFERLYNNGHGLQDAFINYWAVVSKRLAGNPYVIGYDPLNEPFGSSLYTDPLIMTDKGQFDEQKLTPMYRRAFEQYHKHDPTQIMMFEGTQGPDTIGIGPGYILPVGFQELPGGNDNAATHVLNEHTYCCQMNPEVCASGEPPLRLEKECQSFHNRRVGQRAKDAERLGVPLFLSEFGACYNTPDCAMEIGLVADACDSNLIGWGYWQFKTYWDLTTSAGTKSEGFYGDDGELQMFKLNALARTYIPYTQGRLRSMQYDRKTFSFTATFVLDTSIEAPTVLYKTINRKDSAEAIPEVMVGFKKVPFEEVFSQVEKDGNYLTFQATNKAFDQQEISLTMSVEAPEIALE